MCVNAKGIRTKERRLSYSRFHRPKPESVANYSDSLRYQMSDRIVFLSLCLNDQRTADRLALSVPISLGVGVEGGGVSAASAIANPLAAPESKRYGSPSFSGGLPRAPGRGRRRRPSRDDSADRGRDPSQALGGRWTTLAVITCGVSVI